MSPRKSRGLARTMRAHVKACADPTSIAWEGCVYIVSRDSDSDCFKIGFSKYHPSERVTRHRRCYSTAKLISQTRMMRYARRVEQLVHWELDAYRRKEHCTRCNRVHREWFDVSKEVVLEAVERWEVWVASHSPRAQIRG